LYSPSFSGWTRIIRADRCIAWFPDRLHRERYLSPRAVEFRPDNMPEPEAAVNSQRITSRTAAQDARLTAANLHRGP